MHTETNRVLDLPVSLYVQFNSFVISCPLLSQRSPWQVQPTPSRHAELVHSLDSWEFAPWTLTDSEVLYCAELLFEALLRIDGLARDVGGVTLTQLRPFLRQLSSIYRPANQYHNFRHALDVLQSTFTFLGRVHLVPTLREIARLPSGTFWRRKRTGNLLDRTLGNVDLFVLFLVAIGHDVGHPGLSNMFLVRLQYIHVCSCLLTRLQYVFPRLPLYYVLASTPHATRRRHRTLHHAYSYPNTPATLRPP